eukprot:TRINITY_DN4957_c0_g1_i1.p2 TRINITY_DN4957_c0_g1~~TRINITY_DN4957_c0_g1_i1.p2  ORF type:complete len:100 (-),score=30.75 TRINITY_DN4957_c0_g1_i1:107-385(-)
MPGAWDSIKDDLGATLVDFIQTDGRLMAPQITAALLEDDSDCLTANAYSFQLQGGKVVIECLWVDDQRWEGPKAEFVQAFEAYTEQSGSGSP